MDVTGPLWGAGTSPQSYGGTVGLTCTDCHDPHGQSNYRLLKATVNGVTVGGYDSDDVPTPFVFSNEIGYPVPTYVANPGGGVQTGSLPDGGWLKHEAGAAQMALYRPNYTDTDGTAILHTETRAPDQVRCRSGARRVTPNYNQPNAGVRRDLQLHPVSAGLLALPLRSAPSPTTATRSTRTWPLASALVARCSEQVVSDPAWVPLENPGSGGGGFERWLHRLPDLPPCTRFVR